MLYAGASIHKSIELLMNYKKTLKGNVDFNKVRIRLESEFYLMDKMLDELFLIVEERYIRNQKDFVGLRAVIRIANSTIPKIETIQDAIDIIDMLERFKELNYKGLNVSECNQAIKMLMQDNFYESAEELSEIQCVSIMQNIDANRNFNVFSARARKGMTLTTMKQNASTELTSYALEDRTEYYAECKKSCDRVIKGLLSGSRISNNIFDMMYLCPKVAWKPSYTNTGGLAERSEKAMFKHHIKYLREDGIFVFVIPMSRMTRDMALTISKSLYDVEVMRKDYSTLKQIIIIGKRKIDNEDDEILYSELSTIDYDKLSLTCKMKYNIPTGGILVPDLFKGSSLDTDELGELINTSGLMDSFWDKHEANKEKQSTRPLLPFTMGQIGLVLTSGCLDGLVEEYEGQYHAIKGMVTKIRHNTTNNNASNEETNIETISNKVQINIITPDGEFIELA